MLKKIYTFGFVVLINTISSFAQDPVMAIYERMDRILEYRDYDNGNPLSTFTDAAEVVHIVLGLQLPERYTNNLKGKKASASKTTKYPGVRPSTDVENVSGVMDYLKVAYMTSVGIVEGFLRADDREFESLPNKIRKEFQGAKKYYDIRGLKKAAMRTVKSKSQNSLALGHLGAALKLYDAAILSVLIGQKTEKREGLTIFAENALEGADKALDEGDDKTAAQLKREAKTKRDMAKVIDLELNELKTKFEKLKWNPAQQLDEDKFHEYAEWIDYLSEVFAQAYSKARGGKNMTLEISSKKAPNADIAKEDIARFKNFYKNTKGVKTLRVKVEGPTTKRSKGGKRSAAGNDMQLYNDMKSIEGADFRGPENYIYNAKKLVLQTSDLRKLTKTKKLTLEVYKPGKDITIKLPKNIINLELIFFVKDKDFVFADYENMIKNIFEDNGINTEVEFRMKFPRMNKSPAAKFQRALAGVDGFFIFINATGYIGILRW